MAKRSRPTTSTAVADAAGKRSRRSPAPSRPLSPRQALAAASQGSDLIQTFETQLLESQLEEDLIAPIDRSVAGTAATADAEVDDIHSDDGDNFDDIGWDCLKGYMKHLATQRRAKSWVYRHGYRVVERGPKSNLVRV